MTITASSVAVANGAALGTAPPAPTMTANTDAGGVVNLGTGTAPAAGALCTLTLGGVYSGIDHQAPVVQLTAQNAATAALGLYVVSVTNRRVITVGCTTAPGASLTAGSVQFAYSVAVSK